MPTSGTRADMALLVACVRAVVTSAVARDEDANQSGAREWSPLVHTALTHGVFPHVHSGLTTLGLPTAAKDEVRALFRAHARRNLLRSGELLQLVALFEEHGIATMPLKGPVLAASLYGSVAMRQFTDLDLLVRPQHAARARALLKRQGYRFTSESDASVLATRQSSHGPLDVDLQWALGEDRFRVPLAPERLWATARRVRFINRLIWQPSVNDQLLLLCAHPAKHAWSRLGWLADIYAFVSVCGDRIQWRQAVDQARRSGGERLLLLGIQLSADVFGMPIPSPLGTGSHPPRVVRSLAVELRHRLLTTEVAPQRLTGSFGFVEAGLLYIRSRERLRDKVAHARHVVRVLRGWWTFTPNAQDVAVVSLPRFLWFVYFLIRPVRLLGKYGPRLLGCGAQALTHALHMTTPAPHRN